MNATTHHDPQPCPTCNKTLDAFTRTSPTTGRPVASVCVYCGQILIPEGSPPTLRTPTPTERANILTSPAGDRIRAVWAAINFTRSLRN